MNWPRYYGRIVLVFYLMAPALPCCAQIVRLRDRVDVGHGEITLLDLMPDTASDDIKRAASLVTLGMAPGRGSLRVIGSDQISHALAAYQELSSVVVIPDRIEIRNKQFVLNHESVAFALRSFLQQHDQGGLRDESVEWTSEISASIPVPKLAVVKAMGHSEDGRDFFQLRCANRENCSDFVVAARLGKPASATHTDHAPSDRQEKTETASLVQSGAKAWLTLQGDGIRLRLLVRCLENGSLGKTVRVWDIEHHRVLRAEVVGIKELHASLAS